MMAGMARKPSASSKAAAANAKVVANGLVFQMASTIAETMKRRGLGSGRLGKQYGDKRDLYNVLGYVRNPTVEDYWQMFLRQDIAKRIVKAPANATWRCPPMIQETDNPDRETAFEQAWDAVEKQLKVWSYFARADRLAGIGYYGVLLIGAPGELKTPVTQLKAAKDLLFLSAFSQRTARVKEFVTDTTDQRFGRPLNYEINLEGDMASDAQRAAAVKKRSVLKTNDQVVDASRCMHFAEDLTEDEVHGTPRLEACFNRLFDVEKVAGGSAEMYWRGAYGGFALEVADDATSAFAGAGEIDQDVVDEFAHGMRRWIDLEGYKLHQIQGQDVSPAQVFQVLIQLISAATGQPQRILLGSERGELSSSQDETNWNKLIEDRQKEYATPIVREFIDRLIVWGVIPAPKAGDYEVVWPDLFAPTAKEKAEVFKSFAEGIAAVCPPGAPELVITPAEVRTRFLDLEATPEADMVIPAMDAPTAQAPPPVDRTIAVNAR